MHQDMQTNRPPVSHGAIHLMLLGSPPDMVHGVPPYRARPPAYPIACISALLLNTNYHIINDSAKKDNL